jgi:hypothetical protein
MALAEIETPSPDPMGLEFDFYSEVSEVDRAVNDGVLHQEDALRILKALETAQSQDEIADIVLNEFYKGPTSPDHWTFHLAECACKACVSIAES